MKFNEILSESSFKFKDFKTGQKVGVKRTPWDDQQEFVVDKVVEGDDDEIEVFLKRVKDGEEYVVNKEEMKIIDVKELSDGGKKSKNLKPEKEEDEEEEPKTDDQNKKKENDEEEEDEE